MPSHVCPDIRIQVVDMGQSPHIRILLIADVDVPHSIVTAARTAKSSASQETVIWL